MQNYELCNCKEGCFFQKCFRNLFLEMFNNIIQLRRNMSHIIANKGIFAKTGLENVS